MALNSFGSIALLELCWFIWADELVQMYLVSKIQITRLVNNWKAQVLIVGSTLKLFLIARTENLCFAFWPFVLFVVSQHFQVKSFYLFSFHVKMYFIKTSIAILKSYPAEF